MAPLSMGDIGFVAIKTLGTTTVSSTSTSASNIYTHAGTGYANPHAVTQIANGLSTTTYSYDNNGNLAQKTADGVTMGFFGLDSSGLDTLHCDA